MNYPNLIASQRVIELFAGPGGYSEGLAMLGIKREQMIGIEFEPSACATAEAAGHQRLKADVTTLDPGDVARFYFPSLGERGTITLLHASPPCQGFSMAGKGKGREDSELLLTTIQHMVARGGMLTLTEVEERIARVAKEAQDDKSALSLEPIRWIFALNPEAVTLEQVPAVLPLWEAYAVLLRSWGYSVVTGNVHAEQYGVPQTRKRAILVASRVTSVAMPEPTHSKYHNRTPSRLDVGVGKWVSMAEALGWGGFEMVSNYGTGGDAGNRGRRDANSPAPTVTGKVNRNVLKLCPTNLRPNAALRSMDQPAPTMAFGHETPRWVSPEEEAEYRTLVAGEAGARMHNQSGTEFDLEWPCDRPAPVLAGRDLVTMPGANANRFNGSTKSRNDGLRVTVQEAGILQSFPSDYPWTGNKTSTFQQVGNAVPPLLAARMGMCALGCASVSDWNNMIAAASGSTWAG
jgi:DNA (cytosine-5)-methyltransferase 1